MTYILVKVFRQVVDVQPLSKSFMSICVPRVAHGVMSQREDFVMKVRHHA